jgi:hypothetical protein
MKILALAVSFLIAAGAAVYFYRSAGPKAPPANSGIVQTNAAESEARIQELEEARKNAEREREKLLRLTKEMGTELDRRNQAASNAALVAASGSQSEEQGKGGAAFGSALAKMMKDPETKKFIRAQQRMMMDTMYGPLVRKMGLSSEESERFKDFMADQVMKGADAATAMFSSTDAADRAEQMKALAERQKETEEETKAFLGEERYAQYKDYQATVQERVQLNMFRQQVSGEDSISDAQTEQLLALMKQEKEVAASEFGQVFPNGQQGQGMQAMLSEEGAEKMVAAQQTVNDRVYQRASEVLEPGQLAAFGRFQTNQLQTIRMGISMARTMFGGGASSQGK